MRHSGLRPTQAAAAAALPIPRQDAPCGQQGGAAEMHFRNPGMFFPQTCHSAQGHLGMCCQPGSAPVAAGCWPAPRCPQASPRLRMRSKAPCGCLHRDPPRCPVPPPLPLTLLCGNAGTLMCIIKRIKAWNIPRLHLPGSLWSMGRPAGSPHSPGQPVSRLGTQGRAGGAIPALLLVLLPSQGLRESKCKHENMYLAKKNQVTVHICGSQCAVKPGTVFK